MAVPSKIKVLIIDDSLFFRELLAKELTKDDNIEVVGTAADVFIARDLILEKKPNVLTLDVEMPKMNGIEFLKLLMPQYPLPVVVVSSVSDNVFEALKAGAVDFVTKPQPGKADAFQHFARELMIKIKIASMSKVKESQSKMATDSYRRIREASHKAYHFVAIGASTGGTEAILEVVRDLPRSFPGIVVVQHMPAGFTKLYSQRMNHLCQMEVKEAEDGDVIQQGRIIIAAGDYQLQVKKRGSTYYVESRQGERVNGHCPSVDVLFHSIAMLSGVQCIGVILTGMGSDGAKGLLRMKERGALTIGQDETSSVVYGMPKTAYDIGAVQYQFPLSKIEEALLDAVE
jgi:two-component system, chemotaxis family, protein-glutamate methylesterase/glutaminase